MIQALKLFADLLSLDLIFFLIFLINNSTGMRIRSSAGIFQRRIPYVESYQGITPLRGNSSKTAAAAFSISGIRLMPSGSFSVFLHHLILVSSDNIFHQPVTYHVRIRKIDE